MVVGYCMKCKKSHPMGGDIEYGLNARGRPYAKGQCPTHKNGMMAMLSNVEGAKHGLKVGDTKSKSKSKSKSGGKKSKSKSKSKSKGARKSRGGKASRK